MISTKQRSKKIVSDINMTNLVDVTMTLLIVFILLAPVIETGIDLKLPQASSQKVDTPQEVTSLSVSKEGVIFWNSEMISLEELPNRIETEKEKKPNLAILLRGDTSTSYGQMVKVLDILRNEGIDQIDIATEAETK